MFGELMRFAFVGIAIPFAFAALAGLFAAMFPLRLRRTTECISTVPVNAGVLGLLTILAAMALGWLWDVSLVLVVPVILAPVILIGACLLIAGLFFGWVVVSDVTGKIVLARFGIYAPSMVTTTIGGALIGIVLTVSGMIPCLGGLAGMIALILSFAGLGATILTRAGSRSYPAKTVRRIESP
jgi:hypothetical protein